MSVERSVKRRAVRDIFSERASLALRALLSRPQKRWVIPELCREGLSGGLASGVLNRAEALGYIYRERKGRQSFSRIARKDPLLRDWCLAYRFDRNAQAVYFYPGRDFLKVFARRFAQDRVEYALTLFSASRLISPYVKEDRHFVYLNKQGEPFWKYLEQLEREQLLYKLARGGNVCFASPFYRSSVFRDSHLVKGYRVVSNLQLYLDLMTFPPSGPEEAKHLEEFFKKRGQALV
jgi:hypothetical protein